MINSILYRHSVSAIIVSSRMSARYRKYSQNNTRQKSHWASVICTRKNFEMSLVLQRSDNTAAFPSTFLATLLYCKLKPSVACLWPTCIAANKVFFKSSVTQALIQLLFANNVKIAKISYISRVAFCVKVKLGNMCK